MNLIRAWDQGLLGFGGRMIAPFTIVDMLPLLLLR